ncbi:uncharacterized protein LAESUDRAFT_268755 [Laetiporus sulphureus 93-53]|uniref:Uncharacterized protein n=1 Tax=Laetiporus sulphureus 93-53 TaxID=1314785 RepID=A0A165H8V0_9APHY|nr:uncharacterized protein LAESUDRAFT_268755 [Laetiporus sulphureus 93-53]KZT11404.1 hypothetical protein LAESUDRAFT_268755 [Laetiporus sulphureus 93-53]
MHEGCKPHKTVSCSPKSMYRLAEKYGLAELKQLALNNIRAQLCVQNILVELFSDFTSRYLEVHQLEVDFFCKQCVRPDVMAALPRFLDNMSGGCLPQCSEVLLSIILSLTAKGQGVASKCGSARRLS